MDLDSEELEATRKKKCEYCYLWEIPNDTGIKLNYCPMCREKVGVNMYKLKCGVDLKQLEQFGYFKGIDDSCHKCYRKDLEYIDYIAIYENEVIFIDVEDFCGSSWSEFEKELLSDLIQARISRKSLGGSYGS